MIRATIKEVFTYKKRLCVILEMKWQPNFARTLLEGALDESNFCNGYVQVLDKNKGADYNKFIDKIKADELTFSGDLDQLGDSRIPKGTYFFGFDSAHFWNEKNPSSKTAASVKQRVVEMVNQMVRRRI